MAITKYLADNDSVHKIRMAANRIAVAGAPPAGAIDSPVAVKISKSNRQVGIRPRGVRLSRPVNPAATDKIFYSFLPVLTPTALDTPAFAIDATITIGGVQWKVLSKVNEDY